MACAMMLRTVGCTFKPCQSLLVELVDGDKLAPTQIVVLHVFYHVLYFPFTLGV